MFVYFFTHSLLLESRNTVYECFGCATMRVQYWSLCNTIETNHHILNLSLMMEMYESIFTWLANDLLRKIRQE